MRSHAEVPSKSPLAVVIMGVTGVGKTTIGEMLAGELGWAFEDADEFHPSSNIEKMRSGVPLTDADRLPWLEALHRMIAERLEAGCSCIVACSALRASYRSVLQAGDPRVVFVHLVAPEELIRGRMSERVGHFMPPGLLESQLETLETPLDAITVSADGSPEAIVQVIRGLLSMGQGSDY